MIKMIQLRLFFSGREKKVWDDEYLSPFFHAARHCNDASDTPHIFSFHDKKLMKYSETSEFRHQLRNASNFSLHTPRLRVYFALFTQLDVLVVVVVDSALNRTKKCCICCYASRRYLHLFLFSLESILLLLPSLENKHKHTKTSPENYRFYYISLDALNWKNRQKRLFPFEENFEIQVMRQNIIKSNQKLVFSPAHKNIYEEKVFIHENSAKLSWRWWGAIKKGPRDLKMKNIKCQ